MVVHAHAALFVSQAESSLRQEGGFLKIKWWLLCLLFREPLRTTSGVWGAQQVVSEHPRFDVGSSVNSRASVPDWQRSCVDLRIVCEDCSRNQVGGVDCFGNLSRVSRGGKDLIFI